MRVIAALLVVGAVGFGASTALGTTDARSLWATTSSPASGGLSVRVSGNQLEDGNGNALRLLGVNRSGFEFWCAQGAGLYGGATDATAIAAMTAWRINVVRIPLNEACWLGLPSVKPAYGGKPYRDAVTGYVQRLHAAGLYVILDLHWNAPGMQPALGQQVMPDADHAPAFWRSVAATFRGDAAVLFDLYNEPHDVSWQCWRDGCVAPAGWQAAGMQSLVDAVRSTGAKQPLILEGLGREGSGSLSNLPNWLTWVPNDPEHALVASFHIYFSQCTTVSCWTTSVSSVAARVPIVTGEFGESGCVHDFSDRYMAWADAHGLSYLGWTWNPWDCSSGPALIKDWSGTPTPYGAGLHDHLAALFATEQERVVRGARPRVKS